MKKLFTSLSILIVGSSIAQTTIPNSSFENWSNVIVVDSVEQWHNSSMDNFLQGQPVDNAYSISNAYDGASALHLETFIEYDIFNGDIDTLFGFTVLGNPPNAPWPTYTYNDTIDNFTGYYKYDVQAGDTALIMVQCFKGGATYAQGTLEITGNQNSWTQFDLPIVGGETDFPDSIWVGFTSSQAFNPGVALAGSWLEIDSVGFEFLNGSTVPTALPNNSFEDFYTETILQPDGWWTMDPHLYAGAGGAYATQSTDAAAGSYSLELTTTLYNVGSTVPALATNGWYDYIGDEFYSGVPYIAQPDSLVGQYKYSHLTTDTAWVKVRFWNQSTGILIDTAYSWLAAAAWTNFSIPLDGLTEAPDSMLIAFYSGEELGSELLVDDLSFVGGDLGIEIPEVSPWTYYPNPSDNMVTIEFTEAERVEVIDISGRVIYVENTTGKNLTQIGTADWKDGVYFIRLTENGTNSTKKLVVRH